MDFFGTMIITPVNMQPFEITTDWKYKDGVWYGNEQSFPEEICKRKEDAE